MEDMARGAAEDELAQARMPVAAHHQKIGAVGFGEAEQFHSDIGAGRAAFEALALDAVTGEGRADLGDVTRAA